MSEAKFDALEEYRTSGFFTEGQQAALDYATQLTRDKRVDPATFEALKNYYNEREICEIVWLVASEHFYNITNLGLNIHSNMLCDVRRAKTPWKLRRLEQSRRSPISHEAALGS